MMLDNIDHYSAQIAVLDEKIAALCEPYERQVAQLDQIPGFGVKTAQDLIGEIGTDMTVFPTAGHLCSWARVAPRVKESGGRRKGGSATGKGNPYIGATLGEASAAVGRTQTFLGAKLRRLVRHMPKKKAQGAVMRTQLVTAHALLSDPEADTASLGPGYYDQRADAAGRPAATSAAWNASATRSPSNPSTPTPENSPSRPANQPPPHRQPTAQPPPAAAACPAEVLLSDQRAPPVH